MRARAPSGPVRRLKIIIIIKCANLPFRPARVAAIHSAAEWARRAAFQVARELCNFNAVRPVTRAAPALKVVKRKHAHKWLE